MPGRSSGRKPSVGLLNGAAGATTPDAAENWQAGGFMVDVHVHMTTWTPAVTHWFAAQGDQVFGNDLAFAFSIHPSGKLRTAITTDGTTVIGPESTLPVPFGPGTEGWVRTGVLPSFAGSRHFDYFTSVDGVVWSRLGDSINDGAAVTMFNSTAPLAVPGIFGGPAQITFEARFYVNYFFGGSIIAWPRFDTLSPRATSFRDDTARVWTVNPPSLIGVV